MTAQREQDRVDGDGDAVDHLVDEAVLVRGLRRHLAAAGADGAKGFACFNLDSDLENEIGY